jgi:catalase
LEGPEQGHLASALVFELSKVEHPHVQRRMVGHLRLVDEPLAARVADGLGIAVLPAAPPSAVPVQQLAPSPALRLIGRMKETLEGRSVGVLVADGTDGIALSVLTRAAASEGATVRLIAARVGPVKLAGGKTAQVDAQLAGTPSVLFDAVALLLSPAGVMALQSDPSALSFVRDAYGHLKAIGADEGGRALLRKAGVEAGLGVVLLGPPAPFLEAAKTRHWSREHPHQPQT